MKPYDWLKLDFLTNDFSPIGLTSDASPRLIRFAQLYLSCDNVLLLCIGSIRAVRPEVLVVEAIHNSNTVNTVCNHWDLWLNSEHISSRLPSHLPNNARKSGPDLLHNVRQLLYQVIQQSEGWTQIQNQLINRFLVNFLKSLNVFLNLKSFNQSLYKYFINF